MGKSKIRNKFNGIELENTTRHILMNKFYNLYMDAIELQGLTHEEEDFVLRKLWNEGTISAFNMDNVGVIYSPYAVQTYGLYDVPVKLNFINERNVPNYKLDGTNGVDCCIGYYNRTHKPVKESIRYYVDRMTEVLMSIFVNTQTSKLPFVISTNGDNVDAVNEVVSNIFNNELAIFMSSDVMDAIKVQSTGNYQLDKLWVQYQNWLGECLTELGIDNNPLSINRVTADQANANNELINIVDDGHVYELKAFFDKVNEMFGTSVQVISKHVKVDSIHDDNDYEEGNNESNN